MHQEDTRVFESQLTVIYMGKVKEKTCTHLAYVIIYRYKYQYACTHACKQNKMGMQIYMHINTQKN